MKRLISLTLAIFSIFEFSNVYSQQNLIIEILEKDKIIEVKATTETDSQSFIINDPEKLFSSCYEIDHIVSRTDEGNSEIINRLTSEIDYLSSVLIKPIELQIDKSKLINIIVSKYSVRIPFEFLKLHEDFIYKQKPILFSYTKVNFTQLEKLDFQKGFIICDLTADPENACGEVHKKLNSEFHYVKNINMDTIRNAQNMDFILMSVHGNIDINNCEGFISINSDKLFPSVFTQKNLKLIYFDSCHLGKGKNFVDRFQLLNAEYLIAPIISNEAGNSSTKTILSFFKHLDKNNPLESLMKTKKELIAYSNNNILVELWFAAPFRLYKMN